MKLLEQYQQLHAKGKQYLGKSLKPHIIVINGFIKKLELETLLDYGSGRGKHHSLLNADVTAYDPAYEPFSTLPIMTFDGVICTDVMEHIPKEEIDDALGKIFSRAERFVFFNISTQEAKKKLPNGDNAHCTLKPKDWWRNRIASFTTEQVVSINFD